MKIDFYDLFSLHTPKDFPLAGEENYITAAVKSRVMENISVGKRKSVRIKKIGKAFLAAAAAVVVLVTGTFAASALGLIDLEKAFGYFFKGSTNYMQDISSVPQNVITTGDDRLSLNVVGIGGTENEALVTIEIKRNDGGTFPEIIDAKEIKIDVIGAECILEYHPIKLIDDKTAVFMFRMFTNHGESIIGKEFNLEFKDITEFELADNGFEFNEKDCVLYGQWSVTFPLEYKTDYRTVEVNKWNHDYFVTEIGYSSISLDIFFSNNPYCGAYVPENISVVLENGENVQIGGKSSTRAKTGEKPSAHYNFLTSVDIDSIESIKIGDIVIPVE